MNLGAIPARWGSTRFPGKALAAVAGRPLIAWVVEAAAGARLLDEVVVVTDHPDIARAAEDVGGRAVVIEREAASGSDRIAHLLSVDARSARADVIVNIQGDEPLLEPAAIDAAVEALLEDPTADLVTLIRPIRHDERASDPGLVKVAVTDRGRALYFSRAAIPDGAPETIHIGLYAFRRAAFDRFAAAAPARLELVERLEQLRALELGLEIACTPFPSRSISVDRPADIPRVEAVLL